jgi:O-antigen ligase
LGIILLVALFLFFFVELLFNPMELLVTSQARDMSFTGRTELWKQLLDININPIIGVGYDSFWLGERLAKLWDKYWWKPTEAHNGLLEVYIQLGLIGVACWLGVIFKTFKNIKKLLLIDFVFGKYALSYFIVFLLYNITEAAMKLDSIMWFVFLFFALYRPSPSMGRSADKTRTF